MMQHTCVLCSVLAETATFCILLTSLFAGLVIMAAHQCTSICHGLVNIQDKVCHSTWLVIP